MTERKIEYQFRMARMADNKLPSLVNRCRWQQAAGAKRPAMHSAQVAAAEKIAGLHADA
jgi:hypothetical protein